MDAKPLAKASVISTLILVFTANAQQTNAPDAEASVKGQPTLASVPQAKVA